MGKSTHRTAEIEIELIDIGEQLIRDVAEDDSIGELAESIAAKGLLQPIGVSLKEDGRYQLRWGCRRLLAHKRLQRAKIAATIYEGDEKSIKGLALVENLHRTNMSLADEVETVRYLQEDEDKSVEQIAAIANKKRGWVLDRMMIPNLPAFLKDPLLAGDLPISHVELISKVPDPGAQQYLTAMAIQNRWNKSQLKIIADAYMTPQAPDQPTANGTKGVNPNPPLAPFLYTCEMCGEKGTLEQFTLVRIHKDGAGCRSNDVRPDAQSVRVNGLEGHSDGDEGQRDRNDDHQT